ncbi:hypothetical protein NPIL_292241, partial [Nephila pilipes]
METDGLDGEGSRAEQVETEGSKGLAREESTKKEQWRNKRMRSERSIESSNNHERQHQSKRRPPVRRNWRKRNTPSSLIENTEVKRRPHENYQVRIYHSRERDEGVMETDGLDGEGSRAEQVETEGSKGLAREESTKKEQWRNKRMRSERSIESSNNHERQHQSKRRPPVRRNWRKRNTPSSLIENTEVKRRPHENCKWRKRPIPVSLPSGP